jgi:hypothetical protein
VEWLQAPGKHFEHRVSARCVEVRCALEKMLDKQSSLWGWPEPKVASRGEIVRKEIVPRGVTLFPRVRWQSQTREPELAVSGLNPKSTAFIAMLKLSEAGLLGRVRRCESCRKWLFARSTRQRFHADGCREKGHRADRKTPEGRAKRAEYMRDYRKQWEPGRTGVRRGS